MNTTQALPNPIIILSLGRSGSTLLQRLLSTHPDIDTVPEPWILLYPLLSLTTDGVYSSMNQHVVVTAINEFCARLPAGRKDYYTEIGIFARKLYAKSMTKQVRYFLDKTPGYCFVADKVLQLYEDGKYIFLWRNPLAVVSSRLRLYPGRWFFGNYAELFNGLASLINAYEQNYDRVFSIRYEDLVNDLQQKSEELLSFLNLPLDYDLENGLADIRLEGTLGDPHANLQEYQVVRTDRISVWHSTFTNPLRKRWAKNYLHWIGKERLAIMGYDLDQILEELESTPSNLRHIEKDAYWMAYHFLYRLFNGRILMDNLRRLQAGQPFIAYR